MTQIFISIYTFLKTRNGLRILLLIVLFSVLSFFASKISLEEDISGFMPKGENSEKINFVYKNIQVADKIIVQISTTNPKSDEGKQRLMEAADTFVTKLTTLDVEGKYVKDVMYKIEQDKIFEITDFITQNIPYFLSEADYVHIDSMLQPDKIRKQLEANKQILVSPTGMVLKKNIVADPLRLSSSTLMRLKDFQVSNQYENNNDYIFSKKDGNLMVFITSANSASETAQNAELVKKLNQSIDETQKSFENLTITYFGSAAVAVTNAEQIKHDTYLSIIIAVILIFLILFWFFRSFTSLFLIAVPVVFGALLSLAALYFLKGTISAIAIGAGSVIFGIAINYSLHFLIHAKHEKSTSKVIKDLASPMVTGSITTVGAFLSLLFISAESMKDFGLFAAFTLLGTLLFVLIFMPHLVRKSKDIKHEQKHSVLDSITEYRYEKNKIILIGVVILTVVFFIFSFGVQYDSDMSKLNFMKPEQRKAFNELSEVTTLGKKNMYLVSDGTSLEQALREYEIIKPTVDSLIKTGDVLQSSGIGTFLPSDSLQKIAIDRWNNFWAIRRDMVQKILRSQGKEVGFKESSFDTFFNQLHQEYTVQPSSYFGIISDNFSKEYLIQKQDKAMVVTLVSTTQKQSEKVSKILTRNKSFVFDASSVSKSLLQVLSDDFNTVLFICSIMVLLFLTISFGRFELSIISFLPMLVSWVWILGIMSMFDIRFNIVNIILATFIFGLGDDYTVFMMDGMMNEFAYKRKLLASYKRAVALSAITMFIGIGTLIFAKHPAMQSLANVTIVGMISVVIISYIIPPFLYSYITMKKGKKRLIPITFVNLGATIYAFAVFLFGTLLLNVYGFLLFSFRKPNEKKKLHYHKLLQFVSKFVVKYIPLVHTKLINEHNETFDKPGIIICNHQSHLDLMFVMMLTPKLVVVTNEWVWNSPFYGKIVKYGDYYPVANGIESNLEALSSLISRGYSIVIFPEGTRSEDCSILRFRRGAFYVAEKLGVDIIPVVVHGIGHAVPKSELLLRRGKVTVKILERIKSSDFTFGEDYLQRAKQVRQLYSQEYFNIQKVAETPDYYSDLVYHNYIYKGASAQKEARKLLKKYDNYNELISLLPEKGKLLHVGCGIGVFDILCSLVKKELEITAIDHNEDSISIALHCVSKPTRLHFKHVDIVKSLEEYDSILFINPKDIEEVQKFKEFKKSIYILIDKNGGNYAKFINFGGLNIYDESQVYAILRLQL